MGCSLESYRARIGTFGNTFKGKEIGKVGKLRRGKSDSNTSKFVLFYIAWYSLNIALAPLLLPVTATARSREVPPYRCAAGVHVQGRTPPSPSPPYSLPPSGDQSSHAEERSPPYPSPQSRIEQQKVSNKILYILSSKVTNSAAHAENGNQSSRGKPITVCYWNKGSSFLSNKQDDIADIINTHKPLVLGLGEAQFKKDHSLAEVQQPGFTLHLDACQDLLGVSRCAVYTHNSLVVKRRNDLEDKGIATVWLQLGLPNQKGILMMCGYRQWRLPGQPDGGSASGSVPAQRERWARILTQWEKALSEDREVICLMDANKML